MGVYIDYMDWQSVWMPAANEAKLLVDFARKRNKKDWLGGTRYATVEALCEEGPLYGIKPTRNGDRITFEVDDDGREKMGDLSEALKRMARFMGGGTIIMQAEGEFWKWVFRGRKLLTYDGTIVYEDELCPAWLGTAEVT